MSFAIETCQLTRVFGERKAVDAVDLKVEGGTFYGFLGPNGAGKSTTIKMLTGLLSPSHGTVMVLGLNMLDHAESLEAKRHIGVNPFERLVEKQQLGIGYESRDQRKLFTHSM